MGQLKAIHTNDLWEPRVRSRDVITDALAARLITTTPPQRSIPMPIFVPDGTDPDDFSDVPAGDGEPE